MSGDNIRMMSSCVWYFRLTSMPLYQCCIVVHFSPIPPWHWSTNEIHPSKEKQQKKNKTKHRPKARGFLCISFPNWCRVDCDCFLISTLSMLLHTRCVYCLQACSLQTLEQPALFGVGEVSAAATTFNHTFAKVILFPKREREQKKKKKPNFFCPITMATWSIVLEWGIRGDDLRRPLCEVLRWLLEAVALITLLMSDVGGGTGYSTLAMLCLCSSMGWSDNLCKSCIYFCHLLVFLNKSNS